MTTSDVVDTTTEPATESAGKPKRQPGKRGPQILKEDRPSIPLPDGDWLDPLPKLAACVGMSERSFPAWARDRNVRLGTFNGVLYGSRNDTVAAAATDVLGAKPRRRRGRR
jgi:hypothetical protein